MTVSAKKITLPISEEEIAGLRAGDEVSLCGPVLIMRDAAQKRIKALLNNREAIGVDFDGMAVFYAGPTPPLPDGSVRAVGPTTSKRMQEHIPMLSSLGVPVIIGKGEQTQEGRCMLKELGIVYITVVGGAAAVLAGHVKDMKIIAFPELGPEAVYSANFVDFPGYVAFDREGNDLFEMSWKEWMNKP